MMELGTGMTGGEETMDCNLLYPVVELVEGEATSDEAELAEASGPPSNGRKRESDSDSETRDTPAKKKLKLHRSSPRARANKAEEGEAPSNGRRKRRARTLVKARMMVETIAKQLRASNRSSPSKGVIDCCFSSSDSFSDSGHDSDSSLHINDTSSDAEVFARPAEPAPQFEISSKGALHHHTYCKPIDSILRSQLTVGVRRVSRPALPAAKMPQASLTGTALDCVTWSLTSPLCTPAVSEPSGGAICVIESVQSLRMSDGEEDADDSLCVISKVESLSECRDAEKTNGVAPPKQQVWVPSGQNPSRYKFGMSFDPSKAPQAASTSKSAARPTSPVTLPQLHTHSGYSTFFLSLKKQLKGSGNLPLGWHLNPGGEGRIEILFVRNRKVQKSLVIHEDFTYTVHAHARPVARGSPIYADIGKNRLLGIWMIRKAVGTIDRYQVCPGCLRGAEGSSSALPPDLLEDVVAEGDFKDYDSYGARYSSALRSVRCHLLLRRSAEVCQYCWQCRERLRAMT